MITAESERQALIATEAYLRAERRNFAAGHELADWLAAEAEVNARLFARPQAGWILRRGNGRIRRNRVGRETSPIREVHMHSNFHASATDVRLLKGHQSAGILFFGVRLPKCSERLHPLP